MTKTIFETTDLDLASFLEASTQGPPSVLRDTQTGLATFHFNRDCEIEALVVAYSSGAAFTNRPQGYSTTQDNPEGSA